MAQAPIFSSAEVTEIPGMQILGEIGRGSQSIVYKVSKDGQIYAAKIPRDIGFQKAKDTLLQFRREAAVLARVRHPGVAEIIEVGDISGHPYLIMEYVEGKTLDHILEEDNLLEKSIIQIVKTLSGALSVVHRYGLVHRDIKPQNILINQAGGAKLIDFGFAGIVDDVFNKNEVMGTFLYSSPEQSGILKRPVDGRSDLYSLGVVLFECATGTPPFKAADAGELVRQHAVMAAPNVLDLNPSISPALAAIIEKLLAKDPDDRYQTALGLLTDLEHLPQLNTIAKKDEPLLLGRFDEFNEIAETPLVGRDTELAILRNKWSEALQKKGRLVLIEGEPGSGKSRLVQELLIKYKNPTTVVIKGRCQQHNTMPLAPFKQGIESFLRQLQNLPAPEKANIEEKIKKNTIELAPILKKISPILALFFKDTPDISETTEALDLLYDAVANFLLILAQYSPSTMIILDDIQWIDDASKKVLLRISSHMQELPLLIVCCARNDRENLDGLKLIVQGLGAHLSNRIRLVPLLEGAIAKLVAVLLGGHQVEHSFINQIATRTNGNPFAVGEYIRSMLDSGLLRPSWGSWIVDTQGLENLHLPTDVVQLVIKRISDLEKTTRDILRYAALVGSKFQSNLIPLISEKSTEEVHAALAEAMRSRLIERGDTSQFIFVHDRIQDSLLADVSATELTQMHQKIAEVLDLIGGSGSDYIYALAKHYAMGDIEKNPLRAFETSFTAGQKALENLAYEEAYAFLQQAYQFAIMAKQPLTLLLEETFGSVCMHVGRLDEAVTHLIKALEKSTQPLQRAQLRGRITKIYLAGFQTLQAKDELEKAFFEIGRSAPQNTLKNWMHIFILFPTIYVLKKLGINKKADTKASSELTKVLAQLYEYASIIYFFDFNIPLLIQTNFKVLFITLGSSYPREQAIALLGFGSLFSSIGFMKKTAFQYSQHASTIAQNIGDPLLISHAHAQESLRKVHSGEEHSIESLIQTLEDYNNTLSVEDLLAVSGALIASLLVRGYALEALRWIESTIKKLENLATLNNQAESPFTPWLYSYGASAAALLGSRYQSLEYLKKFDQKHSNIKYHHGIHAGNLLLFHYEQNELGEPVEKTIQQFSALRPPIYFTPVTLRHFYIFQAYIRLTQCSHSKAEYPVQEIQKLRESIRELKKISKTGCIKAHLYTVEAGLKRIEGKTQQSLNLLEKAERIAREIDSPLVYFEVAKQRALIYTGKSNEQASIREAKIALSLALENGWTQRAREIRTEFSLRDTAISHKASSNFSTGKSSSTKSAGHSLGAQRHLDALLQLSLASASILDPNRQAKVALDQIVKLLGAERAFLFLCNESGGELTMKAGRDSKGTDIKELQGYSSTVVDQVLNSGKPLVISGTDEGAVLGSQSAVVHNLRSIMAAPLKIGERLIGIVYLDNRLAKGIFMEDDVKILLSLANHIAIALETARSAQIEMERKAMEKDLELAAAVQSLLLPKEYVYESEKISMAGYYQTASRSGGDWWWWNTRNDGSLLIMVGDVTGHGAGSAMVTAAVASSFRTLQSIGFNEEIPRIFRVLNNNLLNLAKNVYAMTMTAVEINPKDGQVHFWTAGAPALFLAHKNGTIDTILERSTPLGTEELKVGHKTLVLDPGTRLFIFTDGTYEFSLPSGQQFGLKKLQNLMKQVSGAPTAESRNKIVNLLKDAQGGAPLEDDITFVMVDYK